MEKLTPFLWFENQAEEAVDFYVSVFKNSKILEKTHYSEGAPLPAGTVMTVSCILDGQHIVALNGGPYYKLSEAFSFVVNCESQDEIDFMWNTLSKDGKKQQCGWLKDKYGLSWQVVPANLPELINASDPAKSQRVMSALLQMEKIEVKKLQLAAEMA
jgi:predicted 3-demethylubiquinone-9 3-methyltransferase (glyoxalase superfamily)